MKKQAPGSALAQQLVRLESPIEFDVDGIEAVRASEMVIQTNEHETFLSFFAVEPPLIVGTPEQQLQQAKRVKSVKARCVARVVIPTSKMAQFAEAVKSSAKPQQPPLRMIGR